jgi:hypothetical protein
MPTLIGILLSFKAYWLINRAVKGNDQALNIY